jgi:hypothetical protein
VYDEMASFSLGGLRSFASTASASMRMEVPNMLAGMRFRSVPRRVHDACASIAFRTGSQPASPLIERTPDGFRLGLARQSRHLGSEPLDIGVLDVQGQTPWWIANGVMV